MTGMIRWPAVAALSAIALLAWTAPGRTQDAARAERVYVWEADSAHSSILFQTEHWGVLDIVGWFERYTVSVRSRALDFSDAVVEASVDPASVRMPNPEMAANLRNLLFEVDTFPDVRFVSTRVERTEEDNVFLLTGDLTIRDVTRETALSVRFNGYGSPPQGSPGFTVEGTIPRLDFGVGDLERMEGTGHPMIGTEVRITANFRLDYLRSEFTR